MKYLYFGLGNPGEKYENTRHNAGRILLDAIAKKHDAAEVIDKPTKVITKTFTLEGSEAVLISPLTAMNDSGGVVKRYREPESMIVIVYDDIDLPLGELRLSYNKSGGGHNGVLSVVKQLTTQKFITLRVGVSPQTEIGTLRRPIGKGNVQKFVLDDFSYEERKTLEALSEKAEKIMRILQTKGLEYTLSTYKS